LGESFAAMSGGSHKYGNLVIMKTTLELPDPIFRRAKATAAERGQSLKDFFTEALREKLEGKAATSKSTEPPWMQGFGKLKHLRRETARINKEIEREFGVIEPEDRA
jgi:hypothetical protein